MQDNQKNIENLKSGLGELNSLLEDVREKKPIKEVTEDSQPASEPQSDRELLEEILSHTKDNSKELKKIRGELEEIYSQPSRAPLQAPAQKSQLEHIPGKKLDSSIEEKVEVIEPTENVKIKYNRKADFGPNSYVFFKNIRIHIQQKDHREGKLYDGIELLVKIAFDMYKKKPLPIGERRDFFNERFYNKDFDDREIKAIYTNIRKAEDYSKFSPQQVNPYKEEREIWEKMYQRLKDFTTVKPKGGIEYRVKILLTLLDLSDKPMSVLDVMDCKIKFAKDNKVYLTNILSRLRKKGLLQATESKGKKFYITTDKFEKDFGPIEAVD